MTRWMFALGCLLLLPPAARAQQPFVDELPGMGRPIDIAAAGARRQHLMQTLGDAVVVIPAAHERSVEPDGDHPQDNDFRQSNTFFYFTMLEAQDAWIVLGPGASDAILFLPPRNPFIERWTGVRLGPDSQAARLTGFTTVLPTTKLDSVLGALLARPVPVYLPLDATTRGEPVLARLRADTAGGRLVRNVRPAVDSMRLIKDAVEITALRTAARISAEAHADLMRAARPGMYEYEMEAVIEAGFRRRGADRLGYPSIVGSGIDGTTLHYDVNRRQARDGELVVVDAAAEYAQYTADVTRTFPVNGRFTPRQRAIYELVLGAQQAAIDSVHPGQTLARLNQIARDYIHAHSGDLCAPGDCNRFFIHGLSHGIGMDVHDVGRLDVLAPGVVFTIEPGIYLPAESLGVRIEDDILVTATGGENLSAAAPRQPDEIERLMQQGRSRAAATRSER